VATSDDGRDQHARPNYWTRRAVLGGIVAVPVVAVAWSIEQALDPSSSGGKPATSRRTPAPARPTGR